jgi:hypothetical protein
MIEEIDNVITNLDQLLNHIIYQTKILCYIIDLFNKPENSEYLSNLKI